MAGDCVRNEELGPETATNAPGDFENTDEFADHAYNFINHHLDAEVDAPARFASGPSLAAAPGHACRSHARVPRSLAR